MLRLPARRLGRRRLIAVDRTEWHPALHMLLVPVVVDRRAIPVQSEAIDKRTTPRSQSVRENTFLRLLANAVRQAELDAVILCHRGFRRVSWLQPLLELGLSFVVRLVDDVIVRADGSQGPTTRRPLRLRRGEVLDLGWVRLRSDAKVSVRLLGL